MDPIAYPSLPISGQVDRASDTETIDSGSIPGRDTKKTKKTWYSQLHCLTLSFEKDNVNPPPCVVDKRRLARMELQLLRFEKSS